MKVLELFAGTRSIGKAFEMRGHKVFSVEWDKNFKNIDLYADISTLTVEQVLTLCGGYPDIIWASPDCATYSIAAISHHRRRDPETGNLDPVSDYAKFCDKTNKHVVELIRELNPKYWFIENPRGGLRKMNFMQGLPRYTVTYCQYGDTRMNQRTFGLITQTHILNRCAKTVIRVIRPPRVVQKQERKALKGRGIAQLYPRYYANT